MSLLGCPLEATEPNLQFKSQRMKLTPLLTVGLFVYFRASVMCPSHNFENSQHLSNSTKLQKKDIAGKSKL